MPSKQNKCRKGGAIIDDITNMATNTWDRAKRQYESTSESYSDYIPSWMKSSPNTNQYSADTSSYPPVQTASYGGKANKRKSKKYMSKKKGGKLGLVYYATPVKDIKVAEPTYMISGGKKQTKKYNKSKKDKKSKKSNKRGSASKTRRNKCCGGIFNLF